MDTIIFNITEAAEEYSEMTEYDSSLDEKERAQEAFITGARWAFDMVKQHSKGNYIVDINNTIKEG